MEIILIVVPKSKSNTFQKAKFEFLRKQIKDCLALKVHEEDVALLIAPGQDNEWKILSNKFNEDLFEKYSEFIEEKLNEKEKI